jgi:hypothetical protein
VSRPFPDHVHHTVDVPHHVIIGEPQCFNALGSKKGIPCLITAFSLGAVVLAAIQSDGQLQIGAVEIEHVGLHEMLTAKFASVHTPATQAGPYQRFGIGGILPELAGKGDEVEALTGDFMADFVRARMHGEITAKEVKGVKACIPLTPTLSPKRMIEQRSSGTGRGRRPANRRKIE